MLNKNKKSKYLNVNKATIVLNLKIKCSKIILRQTFAEILIKQY